MLPARKALQEGKARGRRLAPLCGEATALGPSSRPGAARARVCRARGCHVQGCPRSEAAALRSPGQGTRTPLRPRPRAAAPAEAAGPAEDGGGRWPSC